MRAVLAKSAVVFVLALGLAGAGSWIPTQSRDEAATVSAVERTWPQLWAMLQNVDIVHGLYYAGMKVWLGHVGVSDLTLRIPSVVACAAAAALLVLLGTALAHQRAGLLAGLVLAVSPRITRIAVEGRSAALFTAVAVLLVLLVVLAVRRPSRWWLLPVTLTTVVLGFLHIYTVLLLPVLLLYLWITVPPVKHVLHPRTLLAFARAGRLYPALGIVLGAVPVAWLALRARTQQAQVDWIDQPSLQTLAGVASETVSPRNALWGVVAWACAAGGLVWLSRHRRRHRGTAVLLLGWMAWPPLALLTISAVWSPLYSHRYMAFCVPALALLVGMGLASIRRGIVVALVTASLPLSSMVTFQEQRLVSAWDSWDQIMQVIAFRGHPGDKMIDYPLVSAIEVSYSDAFGGMEVVNAGRDRIARSYLWDERLPLGEIEYRLVGVQRLWYLTPVDNDVVRLAEINRLRALGFKGELVERGTSEQTWLFTRTLADVAKGDPLLRKPG